MKEIAKALTVLMVTLYAFNASAQIETQMYNQIFPKGINKIYIHTNAIIEYLPTDAELITLELNVNAKTRKNHVFDYLVNDGRYDPEIAFAKEKIDVRLPELRKLIRVNGKRFEDIVTLKVYLPKGIKIAQYPVPEGELLASSPTTRKP